MSRSTVSTGLTRVVARVTTVCSVEATCTSCRRPVLALFLNGSAQGFCETRTCEHAVSASLDPPEVSFVGEISIDDLQACRVARNESERNNRRP